MGNIIATYQFGNSIVKISDKYCGNTKKDEIEKMIERLAFIARSQEQKSTDEETA